MRLTSQLINVLKHLRRNLLYNSRVIPAVILIVFAALIFKIFDDKDCFYLYEDPISKNDKMVALKEILPYANLKQEGCPNGWGKCFEYIYKEEYSSGKEDEDKHLPIKKELHKFMKQFEDCNCDEDNEKNLDPRW